MSDDKKPVLLACQTCGMEPVTSPDGHCKCQFCNEPGQWCRKNAAEVVNGKMMMVEEPEFSPERLTPAAWNSWQFSIRQAEIDRIVLALFSDHAGTKHVREYMLMTGCNACDAPQLLAVDVRKSNLDRRRAEAEKLMGGKA